MTKHCVVSDIHFGVRKNSPHFLQNQIKFLQEVFFPTIDERGIKHIINCGDVFDDRRRINTSIIKAARENYYQKLNDRGIVEDLIIGNHDIYMRESNEINSPSEVLADYVDVGTLRIHWEPTEQGPFLFIPWINKSNYEHTVDVIKRSTKRYCFGHLELAGFQLFRGRIATKGQDSSIFNKFMLTCSGHYHFRSQTNNIVYLGSPTQHTWQDCGDVRGFHVFDDQTGELEFIANPHSMFESISYDNKPITKTVLDRLEGKHVRVFYNTVDKESALDKFTKAINEVAVSVNKIRTNNVDQSTINAQSDKPIEVENTLSMIQSYCGDDHATSDMMIDLYNRAQMVMSHG